MNTRENNHLTDKQAAHNYGIDFLRIISMMMIVISHVSSHGGLRENAIQFSANEGIIRLFQIATYCSVNSYALISGYVGYGRKQKYSNIIYLNFQVVFFTVITTAVFLICKPEIVGLKTVLQAIFPAIYKTYWYYSAYFCLFFFIPVFNFILDRLEKEEMKKLLLISFIIFAILPTFFFSDFGGTNNGSSFLWLAILYLVGGYIRKYGISYTYSNYKNILGYFLCVMVTWGISLCMELFTNKIFHRIVSGYYIIRHTSPFVIFCAICLFLFFVNLRCGKRLQKFIGFFAPVSFGVYLFHEEPLFREWFIKDTFISYLDLNPVLMGLAIIGTALSIWLIGSLLDKIRLLIFNIFKIRQLSIRIEEAIRKIYYFIQRKIQQSKYSSK